MRRFPCLLLLALAAWPSYLHAEAPPATQWIVVTAPAFREAVQPLCDHRKAQGFKVVVVETTDVFSPESTTQGHAEEVREHINKLCRDAKATSYVLLVGAFNSKDPRDLRKTLLPSLNGTTGRMRNQPSDNGYGCFDKDLLPTVAVGRLPARTTEEAKAMVQKILAFEKDAKPGEWRRRLTVLAGSPAFSPVVDKLVEQLALARLAKLDPSWSGKAIYANLQSRFCVPDKELRRRAWAYVEEGQALTLYLGHSNEQGFAAGPDGYLDREDWAKLQIQRGAGVFATFGCLGCQFGDEDHEGYGIAALRNPHGPVAVMGSHGICFAAMVQLASDSLFQNFCSAKPPERLGEVWLKLKEGLAKGKIDGLSYWLLDKADGDPGIPQATQRLEHLEMFVLLGDPALLLPTLPMNISLKAKGQARPGSFLVVTGKVPERLDGAKIRLTLERPLTSEPLGLQPVPKTPGPEQSRILLANHDLANRFVLTTQEVTVCHGRFEVPLKLPAKIPWPRLIVRVYAATNRQEGMVVLEIVVPPQKDH